MSANDHVMADLIEKVYIVERRYRNETGKAPDTVILGVKEFEISRLIDETISSRFNLQGLPRTVCGLKVAMHPDASYIAVTRNEGCP